MKLSKKEIIVKAFLYRFFVILYELTLATILGLLGFTITGFVITNNLLKIVGFIIFELFWTRHIALRYRLLERVILNRIKHSKWVLMVIAVTTVLMFILIWALLRAILIYY